VSLAVVAVILVSTWSLLRDSVHLSLDGVPSGVNSGAVMSFLAGQRGVTDVHDLHIWALSTTSVALTAHLVVPERSRGRAIAHPGAFPQEALSHRSCDAADRAGPVRSRMRGVGEPDQRGRTRRVGAAVYGSSGQ